jgi:hypothetical protein
MSSRTHPDFEWARGAPSADAYLSKDKTSRRMRSRLLNGYYDFAVCFWGTIGKIVEIGDSKSANYYLIRDKGNARETFSRIDWNDNLMICNGAAQVTSEMLIEIYEKNAQDINNNDLT